MSESKVDKQLPAKGGCREIFVAFQKGRCDFTGDSERTRSQHGKKVKTSSNYGTAVMKRRSRQRLLGSGQHEDGRNTQRRRKQWKRQERTPKEACWRWCRRVSGVRLELCYDLASGGSRLTLAPAESMRRPHPKQY